MFSGVKSTTTPAAFKFEFELYISKLHVYTLHLFYAKFEFTNEFLKKFKFKFKIFNQKP